jgi:hypothetical protein
MAGPVNAVIGEEYGTDLPQTEVPERDLTTERNAAKFSKSKEFQVLKDHLNQRIDYYQKFLPNGEAVLEQKNVTHAELGQRWMTANAVITEFRSIISAYEQAAQVVKEADERELPAA